MRHVKAWVTALAAVLGVSALSGCSVEDVEAFLSSPSDSPSAAEGPAAESSAAARERLDELPVSPAGPMDGYSRDRFPHWITISPGCNTREAVLSRDGENVETDDECRAVSGSWLSPYDGQTWTDAADLDIDHMVPLAEAWRSGAADWSDDRREEFANDMERAQLFAVTNSVNRSKGDQAPDQWMPPLEDYWCTYSVHWIEVKHHYELSVTEEEKATLQETLDGC
ncbi:hypothetical protein FHR81_000519 [Actinoalloteichus hoggarensis]|uniref:GmrSD restriction endonucleases C-terminal domain-containing protein n=1 Tax=Actinoalloteichus hoggarensis TaxID=1470176 RepID=A0A221W273_9PSEU|nr:HNH endonuclease family protein [Actinoalloteichus hoggarensis]ASO19803.1 hypothetical protein AHOG_10800 [Actinoalloteichus hoggarensis]MBB5919490.1 hypothetical protein [Actinoalloteichus hoggarensis]